MLGAISLSQGNERILIKTDSTTATKILNKRWCKKNDTINRYIAIFDSLCTTKSLSIQVAHVARENNWTAHFLSQANLLKANTFGKLSRRRNPWHLDQYS